MQANIDYDEEGDTLYIAFSEPQPADESDVTDGVVVRTRNDKIVGLRILNARDRVYQAA